MAKKIWKLIFNKETILYIVFGLLTTLIYSAVCYVLMEVVWKGNEATWVWVTAQAIAWVISVIFAFITNKIFVFESKGKDAKTMWKETSLFIVVRVLSQGLQYGGTALLIPVMSDVSLFGLSPTSIATYIVQVFVIIANYFFSKLLIFKKEPVTKS